MKHGFVKVFKARACTAPVSEHPSVHHERGRQRIPCPPGAYQKHPRRQAEELHQPGAACRQKSGHIAAPSASGKRSSGYGRSTFGRGRGSFSRNRLFSSSRRVVVKARIVRHQGKSFRSAPMSAHLSYLKREGVSRDGEKGVMFDAENERADDLAFSDRSKDDRHHFRFIVSPEDAGDMTDLREFTRDLARQMENDLGTRLDWVAVDHWNTDNPMSIFWCAASTRPAPIW